MLSFEEVMKATRSAPLAKDTHESLMAQSERYATLTENRNELKRYNKIIKTMQESQSDALQFQAFIDRKAVTEAAKEEAAKLIASEKGTVDTVSTATKAKKVA